MSSAPAQGLSIEVPARTHASSNLHWSKARFQQATARSLSAHRRRHAFDRIADIDTLAMARLRELCGVEVLLEFAGETIPGR